VQSVSGMKNVMASWQRYRGSVKEGSKSIGRAQNEWKNRHDSVRRILDGGMTR